MSTEHLPTPLPDRLDALFGQYTAANQARGLAYGLVGPSGLVHGAGFGVAGEAGIAPDCDTVFPIASMSKSFVACSALLARDRGLIDLDAPITGQVPEFAGVAPDGETWDAPTVRMLLSMSGGLTEDNAWVDPFVDMPMAGLLSSVRDGVPYSSVPGAVYEYSNLGYALAGLAVGRAVGRPIEQWVQEELLEPLGLTRTWFDSAAPGEPGPRATGYTLDRSGAWVGYAPVASDAFAAAGGLQSTVRDLATWVTWLGAAFRPAGGDAAGALGALGDGPVRRSSRREMQRVHQIQLPALSSRPDGAWRFSAGGYGLGLNITEDLHRGTIVSHSGGLPGFLLHMAWHPDSGHGIVMLSNSHRGDPVALATEALFRVLDQHAAPARTVRLWPATARLQQQAEALVRAWDDDLAGRIFAPNVDVDRPLTERRAEIAALIDRIGPLADPPPAGRTPAVVRAESPADVTWAIPAERGELVCRIHLTPVRPPRIQEFDVAGYPADSPRSARPADISTGRRGTGPVLDSAAHVRVEWPVREP